MSKLQLIEQQLIAMDGAGFQNLCDVYLTLRYQERISFNRTGSQLGKQKTVKGTPDTFFRLDDGKLSFVEFTTTDQSLISKIKADIDKCVDREKIGIDPVGVSSVIVCFNSRITVSDETDLQQYAINAGVKLVLIGLDDLATEIYSKYLILAKDILGIPLDTGQILPLKNFVDEYNNKGGQLSTPLNNDFFHREAELKALEEALSTKDLIILTGAAGVGKSKIALQAAENFLAVNPSYGSFAIAKKDVDISDDLRIHLDQDKDFLLLVDDANRQLLNLRQILGVFREKRIGNIKVIITVRDYALEQIRLECIDYDYNTLPIAKFSDQHITDIISSDSFEIRNQEYQRRIISLADGNARLAIMGARLAKRANHEFLYGSVSELYDDYFQTFVRDFDTLKDKSILKTLGLISFFFSIQRDDKEFVERMLSQFELDYYKFNEAIDELEKRELIDVQYDIARVSEQVTATYFFYKVFIKEKLLSFESLLLNYFPLWNKRFSDTVIAANNTFGFEAVLNEIDPALDKYIEVNQPNEENILAFFSLFWFYKRTEALGYFYGIISALPVPDQAEYDTHYEHNDHVWDRDSVLTQLVKFFDHNTDAYLPALELAFEYCRKVPEKLPVLIRRIHEKIQFEREDEITGYARQINLVDMLIKHVKQGDELYTKSFIALAPHFLKYSYRISAMTRGDMISMYEYQVPDTHEIVDFRKSIWQELFQLFPSNQIEVLTILLKLRPTNPDFDKALLTTDMEQILPFIESHLDSSNFTHVNYVQRFIEWAEHKKLGGQNLGELKRNFTNEEYRLYRKLDWSMLRDRHEYDFEDYSEYESLKEKDVRQSFSFSSSTEFSPFLNAVSRALEIDKDKVWSIWHTTDIIIQETFTNNPELGLELLSSILDISSFGGNALHRSMRAIVEKSEEYATALWTVVSTKESEHQTYWQISFFEHLPVAYINEIYLARFRQTVESIQRSMTIHMPVFMKFAEHHPKIIQETLQIIADKNRNNNIVVTLKQIDYQQLSQLAGLDDSLLEEIYLNQEAIDDFHDYGNDGLRFLV